ncbi:MAG: hypothetical protein BGP02_14390 [Pandoraea sp. 64-18]|nr:MAG: hypothetical protein BGP02_14390 [Pandoraea sp. 64-18]
MHVLELNREERDYFLKGNKNAKAAWRRAVRVTTGTVPTWAVTTRATRGLRDDAQVTTHNPAEVTIEYTARELEVIRADRERAARMLDPDYDPLVDL